MLTLPPALRLTPAQFAEVCATNPEAALELEAGPQFPGLAIALRRIWEV
jgi:hypothetical protein